MAQVQLADHVSVSRGPYAHHGIHVGGNLVAHFTDVRGGKGDATIRLGTLYEFAAGGSVRVVGYGTCDPVVTVLNRVRVALGSSGYDLFQNNCEHFARWCKTGRHESLQVKRALLGGAVVATTAAMFYAMWRADQRRVTGQPETPSRCIAVTARGTRCKNRSRPSNRGYCGIHRR